MSSYRNLSIWCLIYLFFFQITSQSVLSYMGTAPSSSARPFESTSIIKSFLDFLIPAAAAADDVRDTIDAGAFSPMTTGGGQLSVRNGVTGVDSHMGAFTYSYPLMLLPGRGNFAPSLAINYNSLKPNGWLGLGWSLDIADIQRSTKDHPPHYTDNDTFIITIKGTAVTLVRETGEYRLKDEGMFLRVVKSGDTWTATDKNGTRYFFGETDNSRLNGPNGAFKWCLARTVDANGNAVVFTYSKDTDNNQIYPERISYDVNNSIEFEYDAQRRDTPTFYNSYFPIRTVRRLRHIRMYNGETSAENLVRRYELTYDDTNPTNESFLGKITLYGSEGGSLPPVIFDYNRSVPAPRCMFDQHQTGAWPSWGENFWPADYNGDGKTDLLVTPGPENDGSGWHLYFSDNGTFNATADAQGPQFTSTTVIYPADFNLDGKMDFLSKKMTSEQTEIYISNGNGFEPPVNGPKVGASDTFFYVDLHVADPTGDRRPDVLVHSYGLRLATGAGAVSLFTNNNGNFTETSILGFPDVRDNVITHRRPLLIGDYNGDGKMDFFAQDFNRDGQPGCELFLSTGSGFVGAGQGNPDYTLAEGLSYKDRSFVGDYNGDGRSDLLTIFNLYIYSDGYAGYRLYLSTGDNFVRVAEDSWPSRKERIMPADYNGDGLTDLLVTADRNLDED